MSIIKARSPFTIKHTESNVPTTLPIFTCEDTEITGLAIASDGTVTNPTVSVGTFHSIEPSTFSTVTEDKVHNVVVLITYDPSTHRSPYETSGELRCVVEVTQTGTPTVDTSCKTFTIYNQSPTNILAVQYQNCSNVSTTIYVNVQSSLSVCVYGGTVPTLMGSSGGSYYYNNNVNCT